MYRWHHESVEPDNISLHRQRARMLCLDASVIRDVRARHRELVCGSQTRTPVQGSSRNVDRLSACFGCCGHVSVLSQRSSSRLPCDAEQSACAIHVTASVFVPGKRRGCLSTALSLPAVYINIASMLSLVHNHVSGTCCTRRRSRACCCPGPAAWAAAPPAPCAWSPATCTSRRQGYVLPLTWSKL